MSVSKKRKLLMAQFDENLAALNKASSALVYSYKKCRDIGEKDEYDLDVPQLRQIISNVEVFYRDRFAPEKSKR